MALVNEHFLKLANNYLFADIAKKVNAYKIAHPKQQILEEWVCYSSLLSFSFIPIPVILLIVSCSSMMLW